ncbi:hypothetical protein ACFUC1_05485 [Pedococcus sp. NPDC057267]|uniref:hypothetical protein n=1 Tax=Pedococcus sp. NPDC057267 TaxID=3346077 RepID=UPI0036310CC0
MGIWEKPPTDFLESLQREFGFVPPRRDGYDTVETIEAMRAGRVHVFVGLGGNFLHAAPDTGVTAEALRRTALTLHGSTKLNRYHLMTGETALILPNLGLEGGAQFVTVEGSMSVVHASRGRLTPASKHLRSEVAIVCGMAEPTLGARAGAASIDWAGLRSDYSRIRAHIEQVIPGFDHHEERVLTKTRFVLPHPPPRPTGL